MTCQSNQTQTSCLTRWVMKQDYRRFGTSEARPKTSTSFPSSIRDYDKSLNINILVSREKKTCRIIGSSISGHASRRSLITGNDKERRAGSNLEPSNGVAELFERVAFPQIDFLRHA